MKTTTLILWLCLPFFGFCQIQNSLVKGTSPLSTGLWSQNSNISGIALVQNKVIAVLHHNYFSIAELSQSSIVFVSPVKHGAIGFNFNYSGDALYNQKDIGFTFAKSFDDKLLLGFKSNYQNTNLNNLFFHSLGFELGSIFKFNQSVDIAFHLKNTISNSQSAIVSLGFGYHFSEKVDGIVFLEKDGDTPLSINTQINYYLLPSLDLSFVTFNKLDNNKFGISYLFTNWTLDSFVAYHSYLGFTTQFGFSYQWK
jgi:hypothetical protein